MKHQLALVIFMASGLASLQAATYSWIGTNESKWETPSSWNLNSGFPGSIADTALFNTNSSNNRNVVLESNLTIGTLGIGYNATAGIVSLKASGHSLTVGSSSVGGTIYVGSIASNSNASGNLTVSSGTLSLIGGGFYLGTRPETTTDARQGNVVGTVNISQGATLNVGTQAHRSDWLIARRIASNLNVNASSGTVKATDSGGTLNAWIDRFVVGSNESTLTNGGVNDNLTGTVDLGGLASASIDANSLDVGVSKNSSVQGSVSVGSHSLTVRNAIRVGVGELISGTAATGSNTDTVTGSITMAAGSDVRFGVDSSTRATMEMGTSASSRGPSATGTVVTTRTGSLVATGGTFNGYLTSLTLGSQNAAAVDRQTSTATGTLDLHAASVTAFDVSGNISVGAGSQAGSHGTLRLPETNAIVGGDLIVGNSQADSSGLLDLQGGRMRVSGDVSINLTGRVTVLVEGNEAGLWLSGDSQLTLSAFGSTADDSNAGYFMTFENPDEAFSGVYAGFAWDGNKLSLVNSLIDSHAITWVNHTSFDIGAFYDSGTNITYIGVVPEPGSVVLTIAGLGFAAAFCWRKHR